MATSTCARCRLAFNNSERIAEMKFEEGDRVRKGMVVATLDTSRLKPMVAQVEAQVEAQQQAFNRLSAGSRPEEIAQAEDNVASAMANVDAARAEQVNALAEFVRLERLVKFKFKDKSEGRAVSQENVDKGKTAADKARSSVDMAEANLKYMLNALDLAVLGPREEEVKEAAAKLRDKQEQLAILKQQFADAELKAPVDAIVRTRLMEPGEMASPQKAVYSLAIIDRKWVRAYVSEPDLGKVRMKMKAWVKVDSFPDRPFQGEIGFISPVAEFTPKAVQTVEAADQPRLRGARLGRRSQR